LIDRSPRRICEFGAAFIVVDSCHLASVEAYTGDYDDWVNGLSMASRVLKRQTR